MKPTEGDLRAWVEARVNEYGGVEAARPSDFAQKAWRELCAHYDVRSPRYKKVRNLEEALKRVAELAAKP